MIYTCESGYVHEYKIKFDREKLLKVRGDILENCSIIFHYNDIVDNNMAEKIKNSCGHSIDRKNNILIDNESLLFYSKDHQRYEYDEYIYPEIINIIDEILKYNYARFSEIFETADLSCCSNHNVVNDIKNLLDEYLKSNNKDLLFKVKNFLNRLMCGKVDQPKKKIKEYYGDLQECFTLEEVKTYDTDELRTLKLSYGPNWYEESISKLNALNTLQKKIDHSVDEQFIKRMNGRNRKKK